MGLTGLLLAHWANEVERTGLMRFFFLEYAGELRIFVLREETVQLQTHHLTLDYSKGCNCFRQTKYYMQRRIWDLTTARPLVSNPCLWSF